MDFEPGDKVQLIDDDGEVCGEGIVAHVPSNTPELRVGVIENGEWRGWPRKYVYARREHGNEAEGEKEKPRELAG